MPKDQLFQHIINNTDQIYSYISNRIVTQNETTLKQCDAAIFLQLDGIECERGHLVEQCYEYFLMRLPTGVDYFIRKNSNEGNVIKKFHGYIFKLFLKNLVIDFNRKQTRKKRKNEEKQMLSRKLIKYLLYLSEKEREICELYIDTDLTQKQIAQKLNTSRATVNRAIKKLESVE